MAKEYRKRRSPGRRSLLRQTLWVLVSFLSGYCCASFLDVKNVTAFVNEKLLKQSGPQIAAKLEKEPVLLPKPKFEFYTLLTKEQHVPVSVVAAIPKAEHGVSADSTMNKKEPSLASLAEDELAPAAVVAKPSPAPSVTKGIYIVQVASFRNRQDAARMQASLILKGFDVKIASIVQQQTSWHRVMIGPFSSHDDALRAQVAIAHSEHIIGMIRKMDA